MSIKRYAYKRLIVQFVITLTILLLPIGSALAAKATDITVSAPNFNQPIGSAAKITANAIGINNTMYQWWVKPPGQTGAYCVQPYSINNTLSFNKLGTVAGKYEIYITTVAQDDYNNGNPDAANIFTKYCFAYLGSGVNLTKAQITNGKLEVAAEAINIANPDFQFWYSNNPPDDSSWKCSWYGGGAVRSIDLQGETGTFRVIAYAKDKDALAERVEYTTWSATQDITVGVGGTGEKFANISSPFSTKRYSTNAHTYSFYGEAGQKIRLEMTSSDFDCYLYLLRSDGTYLDSNDNGAGNRNSLIEHTLPYSGNYLVEATQYGKAEGNYKLKCNVQLTQQSFNEDVKIVNNHLATINSPFSIKRSSANAHIYSFYGESGQQIRLEMTSNDFDSYLYILRSDGSYLESNDNGAGDRNSLIEYILPYSGTYLIEATQYNRSQGNYTLRSNVQLNQKSFNEEVATINSRLDYNSPNSSKRSSCYANTYTFYGSASQQVRIEMRSGDFDSYLYLLRSDGTYLDSNDNGANDRNSRIEYTLPNAGTYIIEATQYGKAEGNYTLISNIPFK